MAQGAFATVQERAAGRGNAVRIAPTVNATADAVTVTFPLAKVALSKESKNGKAVGFNCEPIEFKVDGATFRLKPGWVTLEAV